MLYPADPPTVEEIVCVMRHANEDSHGWRLRAMIVMLWRGGLPCPLAPHHTCAVRVETAVDLRILFATDPGQEDTVRSRIDRALSRGSLRGPDGAITRWRLRTSCRSVVSDHEAEHAQRLVQS
jgi:hypothetical protein